MPIAIRTFALCVAALVSASPCRAIDLCRVLALGCGDACGTSACCGGEIGCGCEATCACEPECGCGDGCSVNGRQFAGDTWNCCRECGPPICECTGPSGMGGGTHGCAGACEPGCGCEPAGGCGPAGGCCGDRDCTCRGLFFGSWCGRIVGCVDKLCGCTGCDSELYWSEWHNDPPRCCDPCDHYGNWIGPAQGAYRAPYDHPYNVVGRASEPYYASKSRATAPIAARKQQSASLQAVNPFRPQTGGVTRKPSGTPNSTRHR